MAQAAGVNFNPRKILVPVDFSASSNAAADAARDLALEYGSEVILLHVVLMYPVMFGLGYSPTIHPMQDYLRETVREASQRLAATGELLKGQDLRVRWSVETGYDVVGNLLHAIERDEADVVVISTHGMTGWRPTVFGSIAEKVIKLAPCNVLLLRTPKTIALTSGCVEAESEVTAA